MIPASQWLKLSHLFTSQTSSESIVFLHCPGSEGRPWSCQPGVLLGARSEAGELWRVLASNCMKGIAPCPTNDLAPPQPQSALRRGVRGRQCWQQPLQTGSCPCLGLLFPSGGLLPPSFLFLCSSLHLNTAHIFLG